MWILTIVILNSTAKLYVIEGKTKNQEIILKVSNRENKAILEEIIKK
jgi:hypothetical protein